MEPGPCLQKFRVGRDLVLAHGTEVQVRALMARGVHRLGASMREGWHTGGTRSRARSSCSPASLPVSWQSGWGEAAEGKVGQSLCSAWAEPPFTFQHIHWPPWYRGSQQPLLPEREVPEWWRPASSSLPREHSVASQVLMSSSPSSSPAQRCYVQGTHHRPAGTGQHTWGTEPLRRGRGSTEPSPRESCDTELL